MSVQFSAPLEYVLETKELEKFIEQFEFKLVTVSIQHPEDEKKVPLTKRFSPYNRIRAFPVSEFLSMELRRELTLCENAGCNIYFLLNEGDGQPASDAKPGILNCGKRSNITLLKALCIDTDAGSPQEVDIALEGIRLKPHILVETSPGRFHYYFLLKPVSCEGEAIVKYEALQRKLASLAPNLDQSMAQTNQAMRLPTFIHPKKLFRATVKAIERHDRYDMEVLYNRLEAHKFLPDLQYVNGKANGIAANGLRSYTKFTYPAPSEVLQEGSRREKIKLFINSIMENVVPLNSPDELFFLHINTFIASHVKEPELFLPGGKRRQNIEQLFHDIRATRQREKYEKESKIAIREFDHHVAIEESKLPDEFYTTFPGDLGMLTREINRVAPNLSMELCFAGALCISGAMKAESFRFDGFWPMVNGLIIAPPAGGKTTLMQVLREYFHAAGFMGKYAQFFEMQSTVQSLHKRMYKAGGVATTFIDEAGDYVKAITSQKAAPYATLLRAYYKNATSGSMKGATFGPGESLSFYLPPIYGGFLSVWMGIQPSMFESCLSLDDMKDGFLPRFLIFRGVADLDSIFSRRPEGFNPTASLEVRVWMNSFIDRMGLCGDESLKGITAAAVEEHRAVYPKARKEGLEEAQMMAVYRARSEARAISEKVTVRLIGEANAAFEAYLREMNSQFNHKENEGSVTLDVVTRAPEMISRLICNAASSGGEVDLTTMEALIRFHRFQMARFLRDEVAGLGADREGQTVLKAVVRALRKSRGLPVTQNQIMKALKVTARPKNLSQSLRGLVEAGELWQEARPHKKAKSRTVVTFSLPLSEDSVDL